MIRPDIAGQRDWVFTLAEHGYAVVDDMLDPATFRPQLLDAMARHLGPGRDPSPEMLRVRSRPGRSKAA